MEEEAEAVAVSYTPLLLIFFSILVSKLLLSVKTPVCSWVVRHVTPLPRNLNTIKSNITELRKEVNSISITGDFPTHSRLKRKQVAMETELSNIEGGYRGLVYKRRAVLEALSGIILECLPVIVVIYYRSVPVVVLPEDLMWPVSGIVQFPTQVPGGVGSPLWAVCTRQTMQRFTTIFPKKH